MRTTSQVTNVEFPFADDRVAFIAVLDSAPTYAYPTPDGRGFLHASTQRTKLELLELVRDSEEGSWHLLAVWPGVRRSDVFLVDELDRAHAALTRKETP